MDDEFHNGCWVMNYILVDVGWWITIKYTFMIKYLCISLLISWFFQRDFQGYGCAKFWATIPLRVRETKENKEKHEEDDLCKSQNVWKKCIRSLTLRPYHPHTLFVLMSDLKRLRMHQLEVYKNLFWTLVAMEECTRILSSKLQVILTCLLK
jgi:hypothetical protein